MNRDSARVHENGSRATLPEDLGKKANAVASCEHTMPPRKRERAPDLWMIEKLQYAFATASELLCYGRQDLKNAAMAGAVDTLLISGDAWLMSVEDETVVLTKRHGGRVVRACSPHYELDLLGVCALLLAVSNARGER